ncbi:MAG: histidine phosphatase family protein [Candidatus Aenigmarchaeota archaeon]|nr:histidine phosphatase family protein [Candidatus Aenigmarchaeota archaeon]
MVSGKIVHITYFVHGTTVDNEKNKSSGWSDIGLSELGKEQSIKLRALIRGKKFDVVFCSDLKRAVESAKIAFGGLKIVVDKRLRECNYGDLTGANSETVDKMYYSCIDKKFPKGESMNDVENRMGDFLGELKKHWAGKRIAIVAHKSPQLALEVLLKGRSWEQAIGEDWRLKKPKEWKPGWDYALVW